MTRTRRFAAAISMLLVAAATSVIGLGAASPASAACLPTEPPKVLDVAAQDVSFTSRDTRFDIDVTVQNPCTDGASTYNCASGPEGDTACTGLDFQLRRSGPVGSAAKACAHRRSTDGSGNGPEATTTPGTYLYRTNHFWSLEHSDDENQPAMTNACAGPWDVVVTPYNDSRTAGIWTTTRGATYTAVGAFSLFRGSRLTTNAGPEPVRRGATVTVKGRLTRQVLAANRLDTGANSARYVAFAGQPVVLQRRTLTGSYHNIRTIHSNRDGYLSTRLEALPQDRCYRFVFRGTDTTRRAVAGEDCVHVKGYPG